MKADPRNLILNLLLGAAGRRLAAREAVASCALFGIRENSVRVALARLSASRLVEPIERGLYRLGPDASGLAADVGRWRDAENRLREWNGAWIAVHVGDLARSDRAALRARARALALLGLRELHRGLFVRPDNLAGGVDGVRQRLSKLGMTPQAAVFVARDFDRARERRAVALWDGKALSRGYRDTRVRLDGWLAGAGDRRIDVAARESFVLGNDAIRQWVFDPLLPAPLVDVRARTAFVDAVKRFDAAGHAIWDRFLREGVASRSKPRRASRSLSPAVSTSARPPAGSTTKDVSQSLLETAP